MPTALVTLPDVYESVTRRVAVDVTRQLAQLMRLPADTQVYLPGHAEAVPMNGGSFGDCYDPKVRYPAASKLVVRYQEEADESHALTTPVNNQEHYPLFHDRERDIVIRPVYRFVTLMVTLEYTAPSIVIAQRWVDEMRSRVSMHRAELSQNLEYHYALPDPALALLRHLHATMEASPAPTGLSFEEYLQQHMQVPTKTVTTLAGTDETLVIPEQQLNVLGWFDFTNTPPTPERDGNRTGAYSSTITYTLHYNRPVQVFCRYPMLVHNKAIGKDYRPTTPLQGQKEPLHRVSRTKGSLDALRAQLQQTGHPYLHIPSNDTWVPGYIPKHRLTFFSGLLQLRETNRRTLLNLADLGEYSFTPYMLEYFYHMGDRLFEPGGSVFEFRLYENQVWRTDVSLQFKPGTVTVVADRDLDLTKYYHMQISLLRNWYQVKPSALQCLRRYPTVAYQALRALGIKLGGKEYHELDLLGRDLPRSPDSDCPGEGSLVGDPAEGGIWPWPWLAGDWSTIPWDGADWISPYHRGVIRNKDLQQAVDETDARAGDYIDGVRIGPLNVLYGHILTAKVRNE